MPPRARPVTRKQASTATSQTDLTTIGQRPSQKKPRNEPATPSRGTPYQEAHLSANEQLRRSARAGMDPHPAKSAGLAKQTKSNIQDAAAEKRAAQKAKAETKQAAKAAQQAQVEAGNKTLAALQDKKLREHCDEDATDEAPEDVGFDESDDNSQEVRIQFSIEQDYTHHS